MKIAYYTASFVALTFLAFLLFFRLGEDRVVRVIQASGCSRVYDGGGIRFWAPRKDGGCYGEDIGTEPVQSLVWP